MSSLSFPSRLRRVQVAGGACLAGCIVVLTAVAAPAEPGRDHGLPQFDPVATFDVEGDVAEIVAATPNEKTLVYTDSSDGTVGVVSLRDPESPVQTATVGVGGSPTSVVVTRDGRRALVAVDTTDGASTSPSGHLAVVNLRSLTVEATIDLGGQPDSIALTDDGRTAAIAIENQRNEDVVVDGVEGGLPQLPAGLLAVVDLHGPTSRWTVDPAPPRTGASGRTGRSPPAAQSGEPRGPRRARSAANAAATAATSRRVRTGPCGRARAGRPRPRPSGHPTAGQHRGRSASLRPGSRTQPGRCCPPTGSPVAGRSLRAAAPAEPTPQAGRQPPAG